MSGKVDRMILFLLALRSEVPYTGGRNEKAPGGVDRRAADVDNLGDYNDQVKRATKWKN